MRGAAVIPRAAGDAAAAELRRAKRIATAVLCASVALLVLSRAFAGRVPALAYVAAFAEAATIGGLADWYAVVALFRRPLGLPFPHTAIIPANRDRIADRLGAFIETNFLNGPAIEQRLREVDFVAHAQSWLDDPANARAIARRLTALAPIVLDASARSALPAILRDRLVERLSTIDVSAAAAQLLRSPIVNDNRQRVLDLALDGVLAFLSSPGTLADLRARLREEVPAILKLSGAESALFRKLVLSIAGFIDAVRVDPDHGVRRDFDALFDGFVADLNESESLKARVAQLRDALLRSPEVARAGDMLIEAMRRFFAERPDSETEATLDEVAHALRGMGAALRLSDDERNAINADLRAAIVASVERRRSDIGGFVAAQVRGWDIDEMNRLVEINIGPDLQYIRLNGALVGGLAGLGIHILSKLG